MANIRVKNVKQQHLVIEMPGRTTYFSKRNQEREVELCEPVLEHIASGQLEVVDWMGNEPVQDLPEAEKAEAPTAEAVQPKAEAAAPAKQESKPKPKAEAAAPAVIKPQPLKAEDLPS